MKRFVMVASVLVLIFAVINVWAAVRNYEKVTEIVKRTDTAVASTRTTGTVGIFEGATDWKSVVGDVILIAGIESTGTSRLESTKVVLCSDKGLLTYRMDSIGAPWDTDTLPDTMHISRIGNDTLMGHNLYLIYTVTDTYNTVHNVPITWKVKYNFDIR